MNKSLIKIIIIAAFASFFLSLTTTSVKAAFPPGCDGPIGIPSNCQKPCANSADTSNCYTPDFQCINSKFVNSATSCCNNKCSTDNSVLPPLELSELNIFGTKFRLSPSAIPSVINALISTFLGVVSFYALGRGAYIGAILRTRATSADDIAKVNKEVVNLLIGFVLAWSFIFIIQFISSVLGIGSLNNFNVENTGTVITIK